MNISPARAKKLARSLLRENRKNGRSWRVIAHEDYSDKINHATLCRFAIHKGTWIPKEHDILLTLGLIKPRKQTPKPISEMTPTELLRALREREVMQAPSRHLIKFLRERGFTWLKYPSSRRAA